MDWQPTREGQIVSINAAKFDIPPHTEHLNVIIEGFEAGGDSAICVFFHHHQAAEVLVVGLGIVGPVVVRWKARLFAGQGGCGRDLSHLLDVHRLMDPHEFMQVIRLEVVNGSI